MLVGFGIEGVEALPGWIVRYDGRGPALGEELSQAVAVVGGIAGTKAAGGQRSEKRLSDAYVAELAWRHLERDKSAFAINNGVDFGRATATRATNRLRRRPPFPPPADRCALDVVLSII